MCSNLLALSVPTNEADNSAIAAVIEGLIIVLDTKTTRLAFFRADLTEPSIADHDLFSPLEVGSCKRAESYNPKTDAII